jgi:hypothetical protein
MLLFGFKGTSHILAYLFRYLTHIMGHKFDLKHTDFTFGDIDEFIDALIYSHATGMYVLRQTFEFRLLCFME